MKLSPCNFYKCPLSFPICEISGPIEILDGPKILSKILYNVCAVFAEKETTITIRSDSDKQIFELIMCCEKIEFD